MELGQTPDSGELQPVSNDFYHFGLTSRDVEFFSRRGKSMEDVLYELDSLSQARISPRIVAPATLDNGFLHRLDVENVERYLDSFQSYINTHSPVFVVPAAGAASRQFQLLKTILHNPLLQGKTVTQVFQDAEQMVKDLSGSQTLTPEEAATLKLMNEVVKNLGRFWKEGLVQGKYAFVDDLALVMDANGHSLQEAIAREDIALIGAFLMASPGLGYENLPKALMKFHAYPDEGSGRETRLALEEHLRVGAQLFANTAQVRMHFIISEEHEALFKEGLDSIYRKDSFKACLRQRGFSLDDINLTWDFQSPATDSVALDVATREVARGSDGLPLLRKAGHGALLENISRLDCDGVWIQNVDNVLYDNPAIRSLVVMYKKIMAGLVFEAEQSAHAYTDKLNHALVSGGVTNTLNDEVITFLRDRLCTEVPASLIQGEEPEDVSRTLQRILDRPITVAGYVPLAAGQSGGGPFVLETELADGLTVTKANTVEGAEFSGGQANPIFQSGDFFNPVNLFIGKRRASNERFLLNESADPDRCFVSEKTDSRGAPILAYERPGLWAGGLSRTLQVSIPNPLNTFSAVKDCAGEESFLAPLHQPYEGPLFTRLDDERGVADEQLKAWLTA